MLWHFSFNETGLKIIPINKYKHIDEIVVNNTIMYVTSIIFMILWYGQLSPAAAGTWTEFGNTSIIKMF